MAEVVRLTGARVARDADRAERIDLSIAGSRIVSFDSPFDSRDGAALHLDLTGHLILPGLINAHDHLEFNLFPRLGNGPYPNASVWASDIYHPSQSPVKEHLLVPKPACLVWGGIKNLLSGVTTVAHHNPWEAAVFNDRFPVRVVHRFGWAHSLDFSPYLLQRFDSTPPRWPFIVHAAEGTDEHAEAEIPRLSDLGVLGSRTLLVHAVGLAPGSLETIRDTGSSVVWCPTTNLFTLGRTLTCAVLRSGVPIALGTDSALTGAGDIIDEIQSVGFNSSLTPAETYALVTTNPARMLRLNAGQGTIVERGVADLIVVPDTGQTPAEALLNLRPELVIVRGRIMASSVSFASGFASGGASGALRGLNPIHVEGRGSYLVRADVKGLYTAASAALGAIVCLAGKRVCI